MEKTSNIILFPDFQRLKEEIERMRTELSMLLLERDELQFVVSKNIDTRYMLELGGLEYKAYEAQCAALRLKRKIELIQALKNRQETVVMSAIEDTLDAEFAEYQQKLNEQIERMNEALERSQCEVLTDEENKELKKIYREVVKTLHPDLNPKVSEAQIKLFENAVQAYKNGDLGTLRIIHEMVADQKLPNDVELDTMSLLREKHEDLVKLIAAVRESIAKIKSQYPFTVLDILDDSQKLAERKKELQEIKSNYDDLIGFYTNKIQEMLR